MIFGPFERMLAGRYLRARRQEGFVSVIAGFSLLGIALGVATLIIVMSVMSGFRTEFVNQILGINPHVFVSTAGPVQDYEAFAGKLRALPGVASVTPIVEGQALLTLNGYATGLMVRGMSPADFIAKPALSGRIVSGKPTDFVDDKVSVGVRLAERLHLTVGDSITLISPKLTNTPFGGMLRKGTFEVGSIFNVGMFQIDSGVILMPLDAARNFFQTGEASPELDINLTDPEVGLAAAHRTIANFVGPDYRVYDWKQINSAYLNAVDTESAMMFVILSLIILVAAFNIISSLIMLVKDKGADIAILRTMGATRGMIMRIFFMAGAAIGIVGAFSGVILGVVFVKNIERLRHVLQSITGTDVFDATMYIFPRIPAKLDWVQVATIVTMALGLSFLASIFPAWRAAKVDPVEALRYE